MKAAFLSQPGEPFESLLSIDQTINELKKRSYDTVIILSKDFSQVYRWYSRLKYAGFHTVPALKEKDAYYFPVSENAFLELIKKINGNKFDLDKLKRIYIKEGSNDSSRSSFIREVRYLFPSQKEIFRIYREIGKKEPIDGDFHLPDDDEYRKYVNPAIKKMNFLNYDFSFPEYNHQFPISLKRPELESIALKKLGVLNKDTNKYRDRLKYELDIITEKGFLDYFATVSEITNLAREKEVLVGPGRGSAVGSLLVMALGITNVDPVINDLYFERFLNPAREDYPDIDLDVEDERREELIELLTKKFGKERVALIQTQSNFSYRSAFRAVAKFLNIPDSLVDSFLRKNNNRKLATKDIRNENLKKCNNITNKIMGLPSGYSIHAAGLLLTKKGLLSRIPLKKYRNFNVSLWDMNTLKKLGFQKIDILALKNLTFLKHMSNNKISWFAPVDDKKTYKLLGKGFTTGIFQLESASATEIIKNVNPENISDLAITIALNRPGPLSSGITSEYIRRKRINISMGDFHHDMEEILPETNGVLVFQEQVIQVATKVLSLKSEQGELIRKAISNKDPQLLDEVLQEIPGRDKKDEKIFVDFLKKFAGYSFNKSHSMGYSLISYWLAYYKTHHPRIFYKTMLCNLSQESKIRAIAELRTMGFVPSMQKKDDEKTISFMPFHFNPVFYGKFDDIPENTSFYDFVKNHRNFLSAKHLEFLIKMGFLDALGNRNAMLKEINNALAGVDPSLKSVLKVFGYKETGNAPAEESLTEDEKALMELDVLGFNITKPSKKPKAHFNVIDDDLTSLIASCGSGLSTFCSLKSKLYQAITDGKTVIKTSNKSIPNEGLVYLDKGKIKRFFDKPPKTVKRIVNGPVPVNKLVKTDSSNILIMKLPGKTIRANGVKLKNFVPDRIIIE
ncbi:MAG: DNA polymerase III subunit alpha [Kosmotoga sp.]|nr:MAG: DNA polymerase III subunit alpha [Kosmotoga sp.]